jgi:methyl-accepting chemotaxis protein
MKSLTVRLLVPVVATTVGLYLAVFGWILFDARRTAREEAETRARETAVRYAAEVRDYIDRAFQIPRTLAAAFAGLRDATAGDQRDAINAMMRATLAAEPDVIGLSSLWEPDALDGRDAEFVNKPGHDATGRFIPYWSRDARGDLVLAPLVDYEVEGVGDYYLIPKRTGHDAWIEPYVYPVAGRDVLMTSLIAPIIRDGTFIGFAGLDFDLETLTELVGEIRPFETGYAVLLSDASVVVAHPDRSRIGTTLSTADGLSESLAAARAGRGDASARLGFSTVLDAPVYYVSTPVKARGIDTPWWLVIAVPQGAVMQAATWQVIQIMTAGAVVACVLGTVVWATARGLALDLRQVSRSLHGGARQIADAVRQLATESNSLSAGAQKQATAVERTGSSVQQLVTMAEQGMAQSRTAAAASNETRGEAEAGGAEMEQMQHALVGSRDAADKVAHIIKTIDEIAFQTNLLALNAAVEAARAGEQGAGFAVVADEVRNLARRAAAATRESGDLIEHSQAVSRQAEQVGAAVAARFGQILTRSRELDGLIAERSAAAAKQAELVAAISHAVDQIGRVTEANAVSATETAAASTELAAQADASSDLASQLLSVIEGDRRPLPGRSL